VIDIFPALKREEDVKTGTATGDFLFDARPVLRIVGLVNRLGCLGELVGVN